MVFWRKKKNIETQDQQEKEDKIIHHPGEPEIEPPVEYDSDLNEDQRHSLFEESEAEILDDLQEIPVPSHEKNKSEKTTNINEEEKESSLSVKKPEAEEAEGQGWFKKLTGGLSKSSAKITQGITDIVTKKKLDQEMLDELEELLILADMGPKTAAHIVNEFSKDRFGKDISEDEVKEALASQIETILKPVALPANFTGHKPYVVLVCGVNGVGKTTTIGKIAHDLKQNQGKNVMIAAGDTFRAAAIEQLAVWAERAGCRLVRKDIGADAAAVAFEAYEQAKAENVDVLFIDTAGRLHNKSNLMAELEKIVRVLKKHDEAIPHSTILVLDSTTGQNAHEQVRIFKEMVNVSALAVTKLDGSAKGGVVVSLADQFGLPINFIGVGEQIGDFKPFNATDFARSLLGFSSRSN